MDMIDKRNLSSHTYNEAVALAIVEAVVNRYYPAFLELKRRFSGEVFYVRNALHDEST